MSESALNRLRDKFLESKPKFEENIGGQCLEGALNLHKKHKGGFLYWVGNLTKIGLDFGVHHTYFVPPQANDSDIALNQEDNGFSQYPRLTVGEVKIVGEPQNVDVIKQIVESGKNH